MDGNINAHLLFADSDSDDDLLPSASKMGNLFSNVYNRATNPTSGSNKAKKSTKEGNQPLAKPAQAPPSPSPPSPDVVMISEQLSAVKETKPLTNNPDDTEFLVSNLDKLIAPVDKIAKILAASTAAGDTLDLEDFDPQSGRVTRSKKRGRGRGGRSAPPKRGRGGGGRGGSNRGRGRGRKNEVKPESDDEIEEVSHNGSFNVSFSVPTVDMDVLDAQEDTIMLLIGWKTEMMKFKFQRGTKFSQVRMEVADRAGVRADDILVYDDEDLHEIHDKELVEDIPFGRKLLALPRNEPLNSENTKIGSSAETVSKSSSSSTKQSDPNSVEVKIQGEGLREKITVFIQRTTHVKQLVNDYKERFGLEGKKLKLIFDGEAIDLTETPESLDLDGGEVFDIVEL